MRIPHIPVRLFGTCMCFGGTADGPGFGSSWGPPGTGTLLGFGCMYSFQSSNRLAILAWLRPSRRRLPARKGYPRVTRKFTFLLLLRTDTFLSLPPARSSFHSVIGKVHVSI